jgi:hypothetical protein
MYAFGEDITIEALKAKHKFQYLVEVDYGLPQFPEIGFGLLTYVEDMVPPVLMCALEKNEVLCNYGVILGDKTGRYVMYDLNGDGIMDYKTSTKENFIPNWVFFESKQIKRDKNKKAFFQICDSIYKEFNRITGPDGQKITEYMKQIVETVNNQKMSNRDIYYSLFMYNMASDNTDISFGIIYTLQKYIKDTNKGNIPALLWLYYGESLLRMGVDTIALEAFKDLKQQDKDSLIADYYIARIEDKQNKTEENMKKFKQKNPNFWTTN